VARGQAWGAGRGALAMPRTARSVALFALVLGAALSLPQGAAAHALLIASTPAAGATLSEPPTEVVLTFGEAPDPKLSTVRVLDASGQDHARGAVVPVPGKPEELKVDLKPLPDGVFTVAWRTVSAVDGHVAAGSFAFGVGTPPPAPSQETGGRPVAADVSPVAVVARWLFFLGLIALFGAGFLGFAIEPRPPRSVAWVAGIGWVVFTIGTLVVISVQWQDASVAFRTFLGSSVGTGALERLGAALVAGIFVGRVQRQSGTTRWQFGLVAAAAAAAMLVDVLNGHAATGPSWLLQVGVQWVHIVAVGIWVGGLAALLVAVRGLPTEDKARSVRIFSTWAGIGLAAVVGTGFLRALSEVQTIGALFGTSFGIVLILKTVGLGFLGLLGATNRFFNVPAAARSLRGLRRVGSVELAIGTLVLTATAVLANLAPPSALGTAPVQELRPVAAVGSDFGTTVKLTLLVQPGTHGFNQFSVTATDYDTGAPLDATSVALRFQLASRSGVGASTLELPETDSGRFSAKGGNLSLDGIWQITAIVQGPDGSVEVPLVLATQVAAQPVDVSAAPGVPTIYSVHLPDHSTIQVYFDPGSAGSNALHVTFFDKQGKELPVPTSTIAVTPDGSSGSVIAPRLLEPGHFTADMTVPGGPVSLDIIGQAPGGEPLHAHLEVKVEP
jgi:copper transport protein